MGRAEREPEFAGYFTARAAALRRLAYGLCGDWHLAEDLTQTTFIRLYRHWHRLEPATIDAYARRVLVNAYLSHRRSRRRESVVADVPEVAMLVDDPVTPDGLGAALAALPPRQRALIVLRHLEDVSVAEAAELLGITEGTVKSQVSRGLATLRTALAVTANGD
ncbi:MAG TPA: SigE family RNA polymerase sigma factor [Micromonosporaceae bacterium]|nr:SigE family RNA polymerase sigma factor [Micromonosporaceae bacterium]